MPIQSINPTTEEVLKTFEEEGVEQIEQKITKAQKAFLQWKAIPISERAKYVKGIASVLRNWKEEHARLMTLEMGKPISQARSELEKCAWACEMAAEKGAEWLKEEVVVTEAQKSYVRFDPLGVILAVMPWNFPYWQFFRFGAGALIAGNAIVIKHASNVPQCALAIQDMFTKAGAPDGLVQTLLVGSGMVERFVADSRIAAVTLTGSTTAGRKVAEVAGRHMKKCVFELGGSDPFIVLADADLEQAAQVAVQARTMNAGQSCIAAKRFIVVREVVEEFTRQFLEKMKALVVGDPLDEKTQVGPLARRDLVDELDRQVRESVAKGAALLCGGQKTVLREKTHDPASPIDGRPFGSVAPANSAGRREFFHANAKSPLNLPLVGFFYAPTVLADVKPGMPAYDEELFGPVASVIVARDEEDAIRIANDSPYGLGASIWTRDIERGERLAGSIEAGVVFVDGSVKSDPRLPFGGVKQSGYGRELGRYGIREFVNIKTVVVK